LFDLARPAFVQQRSFERARALAASSLACLGRRTLSGVLCAGGQQFRDWSSTYRLFEQERMDLEALWRVPLQATLQALPSSAPVVALIDDTLVHKRGRHVAGTAWRRDPLGPKFSPNFVWANRFLQLSLALPADSASPISSARAIPIDLQHAPTPAKLKAPAKNDPEQLKMWKKAAATAAVSALGARRIQSLRQAVDQQPGGTQRSLLVCADATFTNRTVLKDLACRTALVGRIRKDARLYALPAAEHQNQSGHGRRRVYGQRLPTPEELRQDDAHAWQSVQAFAAGRTCSFDVKYFSPVRWKVGSGSRDLALLVVRPVGYCVRLRARSYRQPAYLICTDLNLSVQQILQSYLWRWEIELNFRDEKTLAGLGQPQVRIDSALRTSAAFTVFNYALLLLALHQSGLIHSPLPRPRWQRPRPQRPSTRITTPQALSLFRGQCWASALGLPNKSSFAAPVLYATNPLQTFSTLQSAVLYATG
jgi:hypothetical protein